MRCAAPTRQPLPAPSWWTNSTRSTLSRRPPPRSPSTAPPDVGQVPTHLVRVIHEPYRGVPPAQREQSHTEFTASWTDTLETLCREAGMLGAREVVLVVDTAVGNVNRRDGGIRADARVNSDYVEVYLPA